MTTLTRVEPAPYRVRAWKDGRVIVDSRRAKIGFGARPPNFWLFPKEDVSAPAEAIDAEHDGLVAVKWSAADEWWEEDERVWGEHPRDPRHRVDVRQSSRHVVVSWQDTGPSLRLFDSPIGFPKGPFRGYGAEVGVRGFVWGVAPEGAWMMLRGVLAAVTSSEGTQPGGYTSLLAGYTAILGPGLVLSGGLGVSYFSYGPVSQGGIHGFIPAAHSAIGWAF